MRSDSVPYAAPLLYQEGLKTLLTATSEVGDLRGQCYAVTRLGPHVTVTAEDKIPEPHEVIPPKMVDITGWNDQEELTKAL